VRFQPSLIFVVRGGALQAPLLSFTRICLSRMEHYASDKHSSLFCWSNYYQFKKFNENKVIKHNDVGK
jgi:hypothetical protein